MFSCAEMHGVKINCSSMPNALAEVARLVENRNHQFVCFFEANLFYRALCDEKVREAVNQAALIYPDGVAPAWSASLCSNGGFRRVSGPSFLLRACQYGIEKNWRHFFLGGEEGIAEKLAEKLKKQFPGLQVAGTYCPPFRPLTEEEERQIKQKIETSRADLLWVGLGGPKQEFWMYAHLGKIDVPVMLGVGAAFDFHSGNRPWAPDWIRSIGLEWFWRMVFGGRRTLVRNLKCVSHISLVLAEDIFKYKIFRRRKMEMQIREP